MSKARGITSELLSLGSCFYESRSKIVYQSTMLLLGGISAEGHPRAKFLPGAVLHEGTHEECKFSLWERRSNLFTRQFSVELLARIRRCQRLQMRRRKIPLRQNGDVAGASLGKLIGPLWSQDQKFATLVAFFALVRGRIRRSFLRPASKTVVIHDAVYLLTVLLDGGDSNARNGE